MSRFWYLLFSTCLVAMFLCGCSGPAGRGNSDFLAKANFANRQDARYAVFQLESNRRSPAYSILKREWQTGSSSDSSWASDPVVRVAIAACLMEQQRDKQEEYLAYVLQQTQSVDTEVAEAAASGLSLATGRESLRALFPLVGDPRDVVSDSAIEAVRYRYVSAMNSPNLRDDFEYMAETIRKHCPVTTGRGAELCKLVEESK